MRLRRRTLFNIVLGLLALFLYFQQEIPKSKDALGITQTPTPVIVQVTPGDTTTAIVTRVIDGDTIEIAGGKHIRYIGIDTPETVAPRKSVLCYGKESSQANSALVANKIVRLEKDVSDTDRFGRLLRYVYVDDIMVNDYLVRNGFARSISYPPDVKYQDRFHAAEREAREANRGLWSGCPMSPTP